MDWLGLLHIAAWWLIGSPALLAGTVWAALRLNALQGRIKRRKKRK